MWSRHKAAVSVGPGVRAGGEGAGRRLPGGFCAQPAAFPFLCPPVCVAPAGVSHTLWMVFLCCLQIARTEQFPLAVDRSLGLHEKLFLREFLIDTKTQRSLLCDTDLSPQTLLGSERGTAIRAGAEATHLGIIPAAYLPLISTSNGQHSLSVCLQNTPSICLFFATGHNTNASSLSRHIPFSLLLPGPHSCPPKQSSQRESVNT